MDSTFETVNATRRTTILGIIVGFHVLLILALNSSLSRVVVDRVFGPVETEIIEEVEQETDEPPPPPPVVETPPPFVPPPDIAIDVPQATGPTTAITAVTNRPAPPPPPPPKAVVRVAAKPDARLQRSGRWNPEIPPSVQREARRAGELGVTTLRCVVGLDGKCESVTVLQASPIPRLDEAAVKHAQRVWKFTPATEDGQPVKANYDLRIRWRVTD